MSAAKSSSATGTTGTAEPGRPYRGRFAPSPSGDLHFGSLVAATGSYLDARAAGGEWLLRIEDLDPPRVRAGAESRILADLETLGFAWDGPVLRQSARGEHYAAALERLRSAGLSFDCDCSRAELAADAARLGLATGDEAWHPPACPQRPATRSPAPGVATRLRVAPGVVEWEDRVHGRFRRDVAAEVGSFVLRRRDGCYAYQLAVVVDDALQGVTDVVRGADLLDSTPRQRLLQRALGLPAPACLHLPLAVRPDGAKLSKSADAPSLRGTDAGALLWKALAFLDQSPPAELGRAPVAELWPWAMAHWRPQAFAGCLARRVDDTNEGRRPQGH